MTIKRIHMIEKILKEIEEEGKAHRLNYHYELNKHGEIERHNQFQYPMVSVYATSEEVESVRQYMSE